MQLQVLGGSGEQGRACFALSHAGCTLLLDAGVKRLPAGPSAEAYPRLDLLEAQPSAVFLSHAHQDHAAALPLVQRRATATAVVYCTAETVPAAQSYCRAWRRAGLEAGASPPYEEEDIGAIRFAPLEPGRDVDIGGVFRVTWGAAGHMPGSIWLLVEAGGQRVLYTGDWSSESLLLRSPTFPPDADAVLLDASYGDQVVRQADQASKLVRRIQEVAAGGGSTLLPLPRLGRGQELLLLLAGQDEGLPPIWVEEALLVGLDAYRTLHDLSPEGRSLLDRFQPSRVQPLPAESTAPENPGIYLATDGMLQTGPAVALYTHLAGNERNLVLLTGYQEQGTLGRQLLDGTVPGVACRAERLTWKVHPDLQETQALLSSLAGSPRVFPVHATPERSVAAAEALRARGFDAQVLVVGERCKL